MDISFIINHLGEERDSYFGAVSPPVIQSSNFYFKTVDELRQAFPNEKEVHVYTRGNNPTVEILRKKIAALAGADDALIFSSGVAAISAAVLANVKQGGHVVCVRKPYSWTEKLLNRFLPGFGVTATMVDGADTNAIANAVQENTTLIYLESPNTFTFGLQDIEAVVKLAKARGIVTVIDNSYCTSIGQRCIEMGVDIEVHSATKYYAGHSDVVAGYLIGSKAIINRIYAEEFLNLGGIISPHDAWLLIRSLRTLPLRMGQIKETTEKVVAFMETHPTVEKVIYPFSKSFPQYGLAQKQMKWCGGLFTVLIKAADVKQVELFCNSLQRFLMAVSWGGYESLIMPACSFQARKDFDASEYPYNMIRFSIGLEDADVLIADIENAFKLIAH
ncbi:MAG TPA: aminotransferase class I/II-fold pyridoxal phosphate-dependent enzyme [Chitinophagales bacterium]|nr:aminotransferase class I/II-fold pyridoxal phosphate-dependent enzyme [Chitinophagales bacterium]